MATVAPGSFRFGSFVLDPAARELRHGEAVVVVPSRLFVCLHYLITHRERAVSRDELARAVYGSSNVSYGQIGQIVLRARRALGDDGNGQNAIRTVPRYGFRWVLPTQIESRQELSRPTVLNAWVPSKSIQVFHYVVRAGTKAQFENVLRAVHGLFVGADAPTVTCYELVAGGTPGYMVMVARQNWAAYETFSGDLEHLIERAPDNDRLRGDLLASVSEVRTENWSHREDLSLIPTE